MKIAIPVNEDRKETEICPSFGRAPYYMIHDNVDKTTRFVGNEAAKSQGGAGIKAAQTMTDMGVEAILVPRLGKNAADVLKQAGIAIYRTTGESPAKSLEDFEAGKLLPLTAIHEGFHRHGGR
ncbi:MAG: NifB/NifX family molybdenum-iron cluster-binding protein [Clostridia bacterium]